jgi:hypothetical protein
MMGYGAFERIGHPFASKEKAPRAAIQSFASASLRSEGALTGRLVSALENMLFCNLQVLPKSGDGLIGYFEYDCLFFLSFLVQQQQFYTRPPIGANQSLRFKYHHGPTIALLLFAHSLPQDAWFSRHLTSSGTRTFSPLMEPEAKLWIVVLDAFSRTRSDIQFTRKRYRSSHYFIFG